MCCLSLPTSLQGLAPKQAKLCLDIQKFGELKSGVDFSSTNMLVAVSGGVDSIALLIISTLLARRSGGRVFCAHVDHGLRAESREDRLFVQKICSAVGVEFMFIEADVKELAASRKIGLEEAGRIIRYDFFKSSLKKIDGDFLLLAHHMDDLCEDVVMRLLRGAGWPSLGGMDAYDNRRRLLRPLLSTSKEQLAVFLHSIGCEWREDFSNLSDKFTRNRVRNEIIPLLKRENPSFGTGILRIKNQAELDAQFWDAEIRRATKHLIHFDEDSFLMPCSFLNKCFPALRLRIYKFLLDSLGKGHALFDSINLLDQAFSAKRCGATFQFPGYKLVKVTKKGLLFNVIKTIDRESGKV